MNPQYSPDWINQEVQKEIDYFLAENESLKADVEYVYSIGTPKEKTYILLEFGKALGVTKETLRPFAIAAELMMAAAMNDDDIIDDNDQRYGKLSLWKVKGVHSTIMVTGYMYALLFSVLEKYRPPTGSEEYVPYLKSESLLLEYFRVMHEGQYETTILRNALESFGLKELEELAAKKASLLFKFCSSVPAYFSNTRVPESESFGYWFGIALQYKSDVRDYLQSPTDRDKKEVRMEDYFTHQPNLVLVLTGASTELTDEERVWFYETWKSTISEGEKSEVTRKVIALVSKASALKESGKILGRINDKLQSYLANFRHEEMKKNMAHWVSEICSV